MSSPNRSLKKYYIERLDGFSRTNNTTENNMFIIEAYSKEHLQEHLLSNKDDIFQIIFQPVYYGSVVKCCFSNLKAFHVSGFIKYESDGYTLKRLPLIITISDYLKSLRRYYYNRSIFDDMNDGKLKYIGDEMEALKYLYSHPSDFPFEECESIRDTLQDVNYNNTYFFY